MDTKEKKTRRDRRRGRVRARIFGAADRPRLSVFRSNTAIRAQIINDETGTTLAAISSDKQKGATPQERSTAAGAALAEAAKKAGVTKVVFDRGGYLFTGNIRAFADSARAAGLEF